MHRSIIEYCIIKSFEICRRKIYLAMNFDSEEEYQAILHEETTPRQGNYELLFINNNDIFVFIVLR
jgi:hypothetical protein